MTTALLLLSAIMAIIVGWLLRQTLGVAPWVARRAPDGIRGDEAWAQPPVKVGLGVFLAVATSLFALLISAYHMRMVGDDWISLPVPWVLWPNTGLLILASIAMQRTKNAAQRGDGDGVRDGLIAAGVFSFAFLGGQLWAWREMHAAGYFAAANPAFAFFYLLTALHGVHVVGGLWVWGRTALRVRRGADTNAVRLSVELCTVYWHFLLVVWVALFAVLVLAHKQ